MNKKKCPYCGSLVTKRNSTRNGVQLYKCQACGKQFRSGERMSDEEIRFLYQERKQTLAEIAFVAGVSRMTVHRKLKTLKIEWKQPELQGLSGYVHLDTTYWGRNWGVLLGWDDASSRPLYMAFVKSETNEGYASANSTIERNLQTSKTELPGRACYVSNCNMRATKIILFYYIIEKISLQNDTYAKNLHSIK